MLIIFNGIDLINKIQLRIYFIFLRLCDRSDINAKSGKEGIVPLHIAAKHNCSKAAEALIQFSATVSLTSKTKESPLHYCSRYGGDQVAEVLYYSISWGSYMTNFN